jgi:hypothetical protein
MKGASGSQTRQPLEADTTLDALIEQLLRARAEDPPMSDEEIRRARVADRP